MTTIDLFTRDDGEPSPFDAIRRLLDDGTEYWSARDLMAALRYDQWRNFESAIDRARLAAENQGHNPEDHFAGASKMVTVGSGARRAAADYHLTRFGAYLVVMNGDPRKTEIAAAQQYFAIRTREAETAPVALPDLSTAAGVLAMAEQFTATARALVAAEARAAELEGPASHAETFRAAEGARTVSALANDFKVFAASRYPDVKVRHADVFDHAGRLGLLIRGNTVRHNEPTSRGIEAGWVLPHRNTFETNSHGTRTTVTTRLTPRGEARLWDGLNAYIREHGSLDMQEVAVP